MLTTPSPHHPGAPDIQQGGHYGSLNHLGMADMMLLKYAKLPMKPLCHCLYTGIVSYCNVFLIYDLRRPQGRRWLHTAARLGLASLITWPAISAAEPYETAHPSITIHRGGGGTHTSYQQAKELLKHFYLNQATARSFYCNCSIRWPYLDLKSCWYHQDISAFVPTEAVVEFEHLYPMARFKRKLTAQPHLTRLIEAACPDQSRSCLRTKIPLYKSFEADLIHIRPVVKQLNRMRGTKWFQLTPLDPAAPQQRRYHCELSFRRDTFDPPSRVKGDIGRMMLILHRKYASLQLFEPQEVMSFQNWHQHDPITTAERQLLKYILAEQYHLSLHEWLAMHQ